MRSWSCFFFCHINNLCKQSWKTLCSSVVDRERGERGGVCASLSQWKGWLTDRQEVGGEWKQRAAHPSLLQSGLHCFSSSICFPSLWSQRNVTHPQHGGRLCVCLCVCASESVLCAPVFVLVYIFLCLFVSVCFGVRQKSKKIKGSQCHLFWYTSPLLSYIFYFKCHQQRMQYIRHVFVLLLWSKIKYLSIWIGSHKKISFDVRWPHRRVFTVLPCTPLSFSDTESCLRLTDVFSYTPAAWLILWEASELHSHMAARLLISSLC